MIGNKFIVTYSAKKKKSSLLHNEWAQLSMALFYVNKQIVHEF